MAGRRILYGWPYYAWSAGYNASKYDRLYTELFEGKDPWKVYHLLKENGIKYVAYDNAVRQGQFIKRPNDQLYATYFPKVFEDPKYNGLIIYKVPETSPPKLSALPEGVTNMFEGGKGSGKGEFDSPLGICFDGDGNILVADTGNGRIEKFSPTGSFLSVIASKGSGHGQLGEPNGIAVDRSGNIYVAEVASNHRVQKLAPDGTFIAEWKGPDAGFTVRAVSLLARMTLSMSSIKAGRESLSSALMDTCSRVGAAKALAMDNSMTLLLSPLIPPAVKYTSPIQLTNASKYLIKTGSF